MHRLIVLAAGGAVDSALSLEHVAIAGIALVALAWEAASAAGHSRRAMSFAACVAGGLPCLGVFWSLGAVAILLDGRAESASGRVARGVGLMLLVAIPLAAFFMAIAATRIFAQSDQARPSTPQPGPARWASVTAASVALLLGLLVAADRFHTGSIRPTVALRERLTPIVTLDRRVSHRANVSATRVRIVSGGGHRDICRLGHGSDHGGSTLAGSFAVWGDLLPH